MNYAKSNKHTVTDDNYSRYVGWDKTRQNACLESYYSPLTVKIISRKVTELLRGVDDTGRDILVVDNVISHVMSSVQNNYRPPTGGIYSRYHIHSINRPLNIVQDMIDRVINIIVNHVKVNKGMEQNNKKLSIWTTVLGEFNKEGLRSHDVIKIRNKHPNHMQFNMTY